MINFPCQVCGHFDSEHYHFKDAPRLCEACFLQRKDQTIWQHIYIADNLRYLEQLNEH